MEIITKKINEIKPYKNNPVEIEPKWVDVIIDRWEQFTGEKAIKL